MGLKAIFGKAEALDGQFIMYRSDDGRTQIDVRFEGETLWLSQAQMVQLFDSSKASISEHIRHIFDEGELNSEAVVRKFRTTASDGKNYNVSHYNLDLIIAVGYRVRSTRGTQFRQINRKARQIKPTPDPKLCFKPA